MSEVLSQSQIDALLSSIQGGSTDTANKEKKPEKKYRKYDFYSPKKFTKDRLKMLNGIYESYARITSSQINSLFRVSSEVSIGAVEEQRYSEFSNALNDNDVLTLINVGLPDHSKNPPIILHTTQVLMLSMIDRMLGGTGDEVVTDSSYTYTNIEIALYETIIKYIIGIMKDAWSSYIKLSFEFTRLETNPSMMQVIGTDETIVIVVLDVTMKDVMGKFNICIPGNLLTNIFNIFDKKKNIAIENEMDRKDSKEEIFNSIRNSSLELSAQLGEARINLDDVYSLNVGDVINLNKPKDSDVALYIEGHPWFTGKLGVQKNNMAIKIDNICNDNECHKIVK